MGRSESETSSFAAADSPSSKRADEKSSLTPTNNPDILSVISTRIGEARAAGLAALLAAAAAGFPMIYQLDPGLVEREGFWRSARWFLLALWILALFYIAYRIALSQLKSGDRLERQAGQLGQQLADVLQAANKQFTANLITWRENVTAMNDISTRVSETISSLAHVQRSLDISSAQREILDKLRRAATIQIAELEPLPADALIYLFLVTQREPLTQRLIIPSVEVAGDGSLSQKLTNLLSLNTVTDDRDLRRALISRRHRSVLPPEWRDRDAVIIVPVLSGEDGSTIGTLVVAFSEQEVASAETAAAERCRNMADDIWQAVLRVHRLAPSTSHLGAEAVE